MKPVTARGQACLTLPQGSITAPLDRRMPSMSPRNQQGAGGNLTGSSRLLCRFCRADVPSRARIADEPAVLECRHITGAWNCLLKVRVRNTQCSRASRRRHQGGRRARADGNADRAVIPEGNRPARHRAARLGAAGYPCDRHGRRGRCRLRHDVRLEYRWIRRAGVMPFRLRGEPALDGTLRYCTGLADLTSFVPGESRCRN